jgi:hypothetical protein
MRKRSWPQLRHTGVFVESGPLASEFGSASEGKQPAELCWLAGADVTACYPDGSACYMAASSGRMG